MTIGGVENKIWETSNTRCTFISILMIFLFFVSFDIHILPSGDFGPSSDNYILPTLGVY